MGSRGHGTSWPLFSGVGELLRKLAAGPMVVLGVEWHKGRMEGSLVVPTTLLVA